jgi:hypothetical protein
MAGAKYGDGEPRWGADAALGSARGQSLEGARDVGRRRHRAAARGVDELLQRGGEAGRGGHGGGGFEGSRAGMAC